MINTVPADALAPNSATELAGTLVTKNLDWLSSPFPTIFDFI